MDASSGWGEPSSAAAANQKAGESISMQGIF
jgi:hypothetical protein